MRSFSQTRRLVVFLPGADMTAAAYCEHGFGAALNRLHPEVDLLHLDLPIDTYLDNTTAVLLHAKMDQARIGRPAPQLWLVGTSLGGLGALLYARRYPDMVAGLILLAPFIGSRGLIVEIEHAGGLRQWAAVVKNASTVEARILLWLSGYQTDGTWPTIYLGFGQDDRYVSAHALIANILLPEHTVSIAGGHDWPTWKALWNCIITLENFAMAIKKPRVSTNAQQA